MKVIEYLSAIHRPRLPVKEAARAVLDRDPLRIPHSKIGPDAVLEPRGDGSVVVLYGVARLLGLFFLVVGEARRLHGGGQSVRRGLEPCGRCNEGVVLLLTLGRSQHGGLFRGLVVPSQILAYVVTPV